MIFRRPGTTPQIRKDPAEALREVALRHNFLQHSNQQSAIDDRLRIPAEAF
jgi:hypothetical protein